MGDGGNHPALCPTCSKQCILWKDHRPGPDDHQVWGGRRWEEQMCPALREGSRVAASLWPVLESDAPPGPCNWCPPSTYQGCAGFLPTCRLGAYSTPCFLLDCPAPCGQPCPKPSGREAIHTDQRLEPDRGWGGVSAPLPRGAPLAAGQWPQRYPHFSPEPVRVTAEGGRDPARVTKGRSSDAGGS